MGWKKGVILVVLSIFVILISFGVNALPPLSNFTEISQDFGEGFGQNHRMDGDFDNDGVNDLVIAQHKWGNDDGRVFIYFGGTTLNSSADITIYAESNNNRFGDGMAVGDMNNDSIDDLAVGAVEYGSSTGKIYVFFGRSRVNWNETFNATDANMTVVGEKKSGNCGNKLGIGDINNDSFDDLLIGCEKYDGGITNEGRAYLFFGNSNGAVNHNVTSANITINNDLSTTTALGADVYIGGDVSGDSYVDILISADDWLDDGDDGVALVSTGASSLNGTYNASQANLTIHGNESFNSFSYAILSGDVNNDSRDDLIVGADQFGAAAGLGKMFIFYGGTGFLGDFNASEANVTITGEDDFDLFSMTIMLVM